MIKREEIVSRICEKTGILRLKNRQKAYFSKRELLLLLGWIEMKRDEETKELERLS